MDVGHFAVATQNDLERFKRTITRALGHCESAINTCNAQIGNGIKIGVAKSDISCPDRRVQVDFQETQWVIRIDLSQLQFNLWKSLNALHYRSNIIQTVVVEVTDFDIENARSEIKPR